MFSIDLSVGRHSVRLKQGRCNDDPDGRSIKGHLVEETWRLDVLKTLTSPVVYQRTPSV
jgi:hypothetical protein